MWTSKNVNRFLSSSFFCPVWPHILFNEGVVNNYRGGGWNVLWCKKCHGPPAMHEQFSCPPHCMVMPIKQFLQPPPREPSKFLHPSKFSKILHSPISTYHPHHNCWPLPNTTFCPGSDHTSYCITPSPTS